MRAAFFRQDMLYADIGTAKWRVFYLFSSPTGINFANGAAAPGSQREFRFISFVRRPILFHEGVPPGVVWRFGGSEFETRRDVVSGTVGWRIQIPYYLCCIWLGLLIAYVVWRKKKFDGRGFPVYANSGQDQGKLTPEERSARRLSRVRIGKVGVIVLITIGGAAIFLTHESFRRNAALVEESTWNRRVGELKQGISRADAERILHDWKLDPIWNADQLEVTASVGYNARYFFTKYDFRVVVYFDPAEQLERSEVQRIYTNDKR